MQKLYLMSCQGYFKIGVAYNIARRLSELAVGNPFELSIVKMFGYQDAQVVEAALHQRFSNQWVRGEWFALTSADLEKFYALCVDLGGIEVHEEIQVTNEDQEQIDAETLALQKNEEIKARFLTRQREDQAHQEMMRLRILELYRTGISQRNIERELFGYTGGKAANFVSETIKQHLKQQENQ